MTKRELVARGTERLLALAVPGAEYDARELFLAAGGESLASYAAGLADEVSEEVAARYESMLARRAAREPLQYIIGKCWFYGREFLARKGVLIPRFDTETLVEAALGHLKAGMRILDLCTGSGCILITLLLEGPEKLEGWGADLSADALACAEENARRLGAEAFFLQSDLFRQFDGKYDIITVNPPYIPSSDIEGLDAEVRDYEPRMALDGRADGLHFYRAICADAGRFLTEGGRLFAEIGAEQGAEVRALMERAGFQEVDVVRDLSGRDRVALGVFRNV